MKKAGSAFNKKVVRRPTQRAADLGYAARFQAFVSALSFSRFGGESTLPPQAANASRWTKTKDGRLFFRYWSIGLGFEF